MALTPRKQLCLDTNLLDIDEDALLLALNEADLPAVRPVRPRRLLRALR